MSMQDKLQQARSKAHKKAFAYIAEKNKSFIEPKVKAIQDEALLSELRKLIKFGYPSHAIAAAYDLVYRQSQSEKEN